jgi:hypothetical protein
MTAYKYYPEAAADFFEYAGGKIRNSDLQIIYAINLYGSFGWYS